jgi:GWxTD domain-containing protein
MKNRLLSAIAIMSFVVPALLAGSLSKYQNWANSPQGYFMTAAERAEWNATVKTDAEAEEFVKKFLAKRDPGFATDVAQRAEMADKHLSVAGRAGSLTTRGKIIILLGPPTNFSVADRNIKGNVSAPADMYANVGGGGRGVAISPAVGDMAQAANSRGMSESMVKDYTFTYAAAKLPGKQAKDLVVVVEVRPGDGTDRVADKKQTAQLDEIFEAAAEARVAAAAAPAKP